jgi:large subunit ribosomal protein L7/L12
MSSKFVEEIGKMSVMELSKLIEEIQSAFGVSAAMPVASGAVATAAAPAEEKTQFKVTLKEAGVNKLNAIKALRTVTTLSLKDAKDTVEAAPKVIAEAASKEEAEKMKKALEEAGAKVELS